MSLGGGDPQVILRRIRHGFIICDDTELCDKIISQDVETEQRRRNIAKTKSIDIEKTDLLTLLRTDPAFILDELKHSPEWTATNVQVRRVRCETLGRLDEIKTENEAKRKVEVISWQDPPQPQNSDESNHSENDENSSSSLFQRRTEPIRPLVQPSPLTALLQSSTHKQNAFVQYAKFDGTPNISTNQSKTFIVHLKSQKLPVIVFSHASVEETIGFICYKYTIENREPLLTQKDPSKYSLYIADDNGLAEDDFPPLTHTRPIGEYAFPHLALIEQVTPVNPSSTLIPTNNNENFSDDELDDDSESCDDSSRSITPPPTTTNEPRKSVSSSGRASIHIAAQESLVELDPIIHLNRLYESLNQKIYSFDYYIKSGSSKHYKIKIDVSGEQIRFELLEKASRLTWQTMSLTTQRLVDCTLLSKDSNKKKDRTRVHFVVESQQESDGSRTFQTYELESTLETAEQFRDQILNIIKLKNPQGRDTYEDQLQLRRDNTKKRRSIFNLLGAGLGNSGGSTKS
ncbi:unnamed protein product [Adineta steineri]|uniref:CRIM domain-containing protein n=1 Tax=Adineta steineri TaxID=433720 RepID=A0A813V0N1_9BILA|nr:unnamed protein product [Adineta steineri]CAF0871032.1 unnamed protein product [Adineta steineri]